MVYTPAGWLALTFRVAPTVNDGVPAAIVIAAAGFLVNTSTVILFVPSVIIAEAGSVIEYEEPVLPVTVKPAAVTVPVTAGKVQPPVTERAPVGGRTTVPAVLLTAMLPKLMLVLVAIEIGVMIVAVAVAVVET